MAIKLEMTRAQYHIFRGDFRCVNDAAAAAADGEGRADDVADDGVTPPDDDNDCWSLLLQLEDAMLLLSAFMFGRLLFCHGRRVSWCFASA